MTAQLPKIKQMGFNAVWINPIHVTGKKEVKRWYKNKGEMAVSGSIYAMADQEKFNLKFDVNDDKIINYTKTAKENGLIPIFDLVLNQVAADTDALLAQAYADCLAYKRNIKNKILWDDTLWFQYQDKDKCKRIVDELWKPFIKKYIVEYGFMGVRVDAVKHLAKHVELQREVYQFILDCCQQIHQCRPIILGELLDKNPVRFVKDLKRIGLTHINNSCFDANFDEYARRNGKKFKGWNERDWLLKELGTLRQIMFTDVEHSPVGGTVGYVGNHDKMSLAAKVEQEETGQQIIQPENVWKMKEFLSCVALTSDSGWYMLAGDEFGIKVLNPLVFDFFPEGDSPFKISTCLEKWGSPIDLSSFIASINYVLSRMPATQLEDWVDHIVFHEMPLVVVLRHSKSGGKALICVNYLDNQSLDIHQIMEAFMNTSFGQFRPKLNGIFLVEEGKVEEYNSQCEELNVWKFGMEIDPEHSNSVDSSSLTVPQ